MGSVKENLIAARALIADEAVYLNAYRTTGTAIGWAFDEVTDGDNASVAAMFSALSPYWVPNKGEHSAVISSLDRAITSQEKGEGV